MAKDVLILGSGPAALFAALAVEHTTGHPPAIVSKGEPSEMFGAMYLHKPIPSLGDPHEPDFIIEVTKMGTRDGYAYNVYGDRDAACSWSLFHDGPTPGWDLKRTYWKLWRRYESRIAVLEVTPDQVASIARNYKFVINSVPANVLCYNPFHVFEKQDIWILHGDALHQTETNVMDYNGVPWDGHREQEWYRHSLIKGYEAWEFGHRPEWWDNEYKQWHHSTGVKPLRNDCDCWDEYENILRIGRYGRWEKGVLTHHAYQQTVEACLNAMF